MKVYPVSMVKCVIKIRIQKMKLNVKYIDDVFPFESKIFVIIDGTDLDNVFDSIKKQITEDLEKFMKKWFWLDYS